mgnify:CR=1 FL=1|jgi:hypothetical protein
MQSKKCYSLLIILFFFSLAGLAQEKKNKDFLNVKTPSIEYSVPEAGKILFEEEFADSINIDSGIFFNPLREPEIVSEDTTDIDEGETSIVEVAEQLKMDSIWITIAEYYAIWDSRSVNPYKRDGTKFSDTLQLQLYDSIAGFNWSMPLTGCHITSEFGMRHSRWHYGTDLKLNIGDPVLSCFDGIVRINQYNAGGYGNYVMVRHYNGLETLYGHLSKSHVKVGQLVKAGELIGDGGNTGRSTGPHLHFEVRYEGNAINPEELYDFQLNTLKSKIFELKPAHFEYLKEARKVFYHRVRAGETLSSISRKYRVPVNTICKLNGITPRTTLKVGRKLRIR